MLPVGKPKTVLIPTWFYGFCLAVRAGSACVSRIKGKSGENNVVSYRQLFSREWRKAITSGHVLSLPDSKMTFCHFPQLKILCVCVCARVLNRRLLCNLNHICSAIILMEHSGMSCYMGDPISWHIFQSCKAAVGRDGCLTHVIF